MEMYRVIQERRRALGMTQEQVADALGVTPPAVNKWEKGATCPDVALLAPLARLLGIDLNELMGFHENLSDEEAQRLALEVTQTADRDGLDAGFALAREKLRAYPNSGMLAYTVAVLLQSALALRAEDAQREAYEAQLDRWYERAANCDDPRVRDRTAALLAARHIAQKDWDAAQRAIDAMPERPGMDRRTMQARLCQQQGDHEEAAKLLEGVVLAAASEACAALQMLVDVELKAGEAEAAAYASQALTRAVEGFDLWRYTGLAAPLQCAVESKDAGESVRQLRELLDALAEPWRPAESPLYRRIAGEKEGTINGRMYAPMCTMRRTVRSLISCVETQSLRRSSRNSAPARRTTRQQKGDSQEPRVLERVGAAPSVIPVTPAAHARNLTFINANQGTAATICEPRLASFDPGTVRLPMQKEQRMLRARGSLYRSDLANKDNGIQTFICSEAGLPLERQPRRCACRRSRR